MYILPNLKPILRLGSMNFKVAQTLFSLLILVLFFHFCVLCIILGGSTEEAQYSIGLECAEKVIKLINSGSTASAVNFPQVDLPPSASTHRILNIHRNVPGVLKAINTLLSDVNVASQILATHKSVGYIILDVEQQTSDTLKRDLASLPNSLRTRILY